MIPLVIGALMFFTAANGGGATSAPATIPQSQSVEEYVREFYTDTPVLAEIARCESRFRQYSQNGIVLRGEITPADVGIMQINERYHDAQAEKLGFDIRTIDGNLKYAEYLFEKEGTQPWSASAKCWSKTHAHVAKK